MRSVMGHAPAIGAHARQGLEAFAIRYRSSRCSPGHYSPALDDGRLMICWRIRLPLVRAMILLMRQLQMQSFRPPILKDFTCARSIYRHSLRRITYDRDGRCIIISLTAALPRGKRGKYESKIPLDSGNAARYKQQNEASPHATGRPSILGDEMPSFSQYATRRCGPF